MEAKVQQAELIREHPESIPERISRVRIGRAIGSVQHEAFTRRDGGNGLSPPETRVVELFVETTSEVNAGGIAIPGKTIFLE